ncbi:hypothetical protein D8Y23_01135 [Microbacterium enclense]|uniref:Uncharacterized protein n=1 Tax=Microbacterium enclense TaxID=993073 RepID=A0A443JQP1_9MICO|nr:hypothetical protein [Microbacterium enclense]RWR22825.1 hypothetical protein D8Y23_01135 [Microbacterium enclense]
MSGRRWAGIILVSVALVGGSVIAVSEVIAGDFPRRSIGVVIIAAIGLVLLWRRGRNAER